ncbi:MAG: PAS domain S-box protein [Planctomycetes bacterium]|nr:PAS domain S-box protein [Planctomycetota bacterium]
MNLLIPIWSMVAAACLTLAMVHMVVWLRRRSSLAHLLFAGSAAAVSMFSVCNMFMMIARTPEQYGLAMRWLEVSIVLFFVSCVWFLRTYLKAGPAWLAYSVVGLRVLMVIWNLWSPYSANYVRIDHLDRVQFLGASAAVARGQLSDLRFLGELSELGFFIFAVWTMITVWRRGDYRRAILVSGSLALFMLIAAGQAWLVFHGRMVAPFYVVPAFMVVIAAMGFELGGDVVRAAELTAVVQAREAELREGERRMDLASGAARLGLWVWDMVRDDIWIRSPGRALFGVDSADAINFEDFLQALHPDDVEHVRKRIREAVDGNGEYEAEYRIILPDGSTRWIAARGRVDRDGEGRPLRMLGVSLDVTRRQMAEERSQSIVEAAPNALLVVDREGDILIVNAQTERTFGYDRRELVGRKIEMLIPDRFAAEHRHLRQGYFQKPAMRAMGAGQELYGRRKDGSEILIEVGLTPVQIGQQWCAMASVVDITERKRIELELSRQRNELAHLSRVTMLGELSGSLAHELNQPLASILSNAQAAQRFLARDNPDLVEVGDILRDIVEEDRRAGEIIFRLRALLRKGEVNYQSVDLNELVKDSLRLIRSDLINHGVACQIDYALRPTTINGDRVQLQQVLINLVMNACDAMGSIARNGRQLIVRTASEDGHCRVSVADRGIGVPEGQLETIFEAFYTTKGEGMGLGLAVCRTIIHAHGGRLWATNNSDCGLTIHFELPLIQA